MLCVLLIAKASANSVSETNHINEKEKIFSSSHHMIPLSYFPTTDNLFKQRYLIDETLVNENTLGSALRVLGNSTGKQYLADEESVFVSGHVVEQDWVIFRPMTTFSREVDGQSQAQMQSIQKIAEAKLQRYITGVSELKIINQTQEVRSNDYVVPRKWVALVSAIPKPSKNKMPVKQQGMLLGHINGSTYSGIHDMVVINIGQFDGVTNGKTFSVLSDREQIVTGENKEVRLFDFNKDFLTLDKVVLLPAEKLAQLQVIRAFPYFSVAMVKTALQPLSKNLYLIESKDG